MMAAIVIPCLNEEKGLEQTCKSFGFGCGADNAAEKDCVLVLVDNASDDDTLAVMESVAASSPPGSVHIEIENQRGYAPPRHAGALRAGKAAEANGFRPHETLIVQADADTHYGPGYVRKMRKRSCECGPGVLIEGLATPTPEFLTKHSAFIALCDHVDESVAGICVERNEDIIVDDKVAAYRLADFLSWGGHVREFNQRGDELFAETTRLFMKAKLKGASKSVVVEAVAYPSRRKLYADAALYFSTAGFPRERAWIERWLRVGGPPRKLDEFNLASALNLEHEIELRRLHLMILFSLAPKFIGVLLRPNVATLCAPREMSLITSIFGTFSREAAMANPSAVLSKGLSAIDERPVELIEFADSSAH